MRNTVRVILVNSNKECLFVQHNEREPLNRGKWSTVGGGINNGESHKSAIIRELNEEFGSELSSNIIIGAKLLTNKSEGRIDHFYYVEYQGTEITVLAPDEILSRKWCLPDGAKN